MRETKRIEAILDHYSVHLKVTRLPAGCRGSVKKYGYGYAILINSDISEGAQKRALYHELLHIMLGHLDERYELPEEEKELEVRTALKAMGY